MRKLLETIKERFKFHSVKLAAAVGAAVTGLVATIGENQELVFALISFIPADPIARFVFAGAVGALFFFAPYIARFWPQNIEIPKEKRDVRR